MFTSVFQNFATLRWKHFRKTLSLSSPLSLWGSDQKYDAGDPAGTYEAFNRAPWLTVSSRLVITVSGGWSCCGEFSPTPTEKSVFFVTCSVMRNPRHLRSCFAETSGRSRLDRLWFARLWGEKINVNRTYAFSRDVRWVTLDCSASCLRAFPCLQVVLFCCQTDRRTLMCRCCGKWT